MKGQYKTKEQLTDELMRLRLRIDDLEKESEERLRAVVQTSNDAIISIDDLGNVIFWIRAAERMLGYSADEMVGRPLTSIIPEKFHQSHQEGLKRVVSTGESRIIGKTIEMMALRRDGSEFPVELSIASIKTKEGIFFTGIIHDIIERKNLEKMQREAYEKLEQKVAERTAELSAINDSLQKEITERKSIEEEAIKLQNAVQQVSDILFITDMNGIIEYVNPAFEKITGYCREEAIGKTPRILKSGMMNAKYYKDVWNTILSGNILHAEVLDKKKDGEIFVNDQVITPFKNPQGNITHFISTGRDITEHRKVEEEIKQSYDIQRVINSILCLSLENIPFEKILSRAFDFTLSLPWIASESRGAIFLVEDDPKTLVMKAQKGFAEPIQNKCARVPFGRCLCGRAALTKEVQFAESLDERHGIVYDGIIPHGHYCVPILHTGRTLGVICVYLKEGHRRNQREEEFLTASANTLAGIIVQRHTEETLQKSQQNYESLVNSIDGIIWEADAKTFQFLFVSKQAEQILGHPIEHWLQEPTFWKDHIHQDDRDRAVSFCTIATSEKRPHQLEYRMITADGRTVWLRDIVTIVVENDQPFKLRGLMVDITKRKQIEEALVESESRFRSIFDSAMDGILLSDIEGKKFYLGNRMICQMLGYSREEIKSLGVVNIHREEDLPYAMEQFNRVSKGEISFSKDTPVKRKDGTFFYADINSSILKLEGKTYFMGIFRDTTERKHLEEQFRQAQKMEAIGRLTGGIAHDFNNMLTAVIGYSDFILMSHCNDSSLCSLIREIKKAGERAASLTHQLLAFSRKQVLEPKVVNLNELLADFEKMIRQLIGEDIDLVINLKDIGIVKVDPGHIEQVIMNLVVNARDAMPEGGTLTIETENVYLDEDYAKNHIPVKPGSYVMLAISDTGIGMNKETQSHLFEPFFTTKEKGKGTGLGLSTVYGIIKQSNGYIWVYSEPGKGTTFKIYLPHVMDKIESMERVEIGDESLYGTETILVVEDEETVREIICQTLLNYGYKVLKVSNPKEAIQVCKNAKEMAKLLVTDVVMPVMNGRELAESLSKQYPEMKVLYVSGYTHNVIVHHGVLDPGISFLEKPFTPISLARKVREVLDK